MGVKILDIGLGVKVIEPDYFEDYRGYYSETYSKKTLEGFGIEIDFVQDNHSFSINKGTIRGIHFQNNPYPQTKLVRCTEGIILDYSVDLRRNSPTYKQWVCVKLSRENRKQVLIPKGFGHAFITLTENCEVLYKVDNYYDKDLDRSIKWDDFEINIPWEINDPIISQKDINAPSLADSDHDMDGEKKNE